MSAFDRGYEAGASDAHSALHALHEITELQTDPTPAITDLSLADWRLEQLVRAIEIAEGVLRRC